MQSMNAELKAGKKWDESLHKPNLDYSEIFTEEVITKANDTSYSLLLNVVYYVLIVFGHCCLM